MCGQVKFLHDLPANTLAAQRPCISTNGMMGPLAWKRPRMARVGRNREGGNNLLTVGGRNSSFRHTA